MKIWGLKKCRIFISYCKECRNEGVTVLCRWKSRVKTSRCWPQRARCSWASRSQRSLRSPWRPWKATSGPSSPTWLWRWGSGGSGGFFSTLLWTAVFSWDRVFAMHVLLSQEIYKDRKKFSEQVFKVASSDLVNMGIGVVSYTLKDVHDEQVNQLMSSKLHFTKCTSIQMFVPITCVFKCSTLHINVPSPHRGDAWGRGWCSLSGCPLVRRTTCIHWGRLARPRFRKTLALARPRTRETLWSGWGVLVFFGAGGMLLVVFFSCLFVFLLHLASFWNSGPIIPAAVFEACCRFCVLSYFPPLIVNQKHKSQHTNVQNNLCMCISPRTLWYRSIKCFENFCFKIYFETNLLSKIY